MCQILQIYTYSVGQYPLDGGLFVQGQMIWRWISIFYSYFCLYKDKHPHSDGEFLFNYKQSIPQIGQISVEKFKTTANKYERKYNYKYDWKYKYKYDWKYKYKYEQK